ncbi:MAG: hypothetical protein IV090_05650 [Candidatus Sericytochromatia bacterium]|nr:hypothetical protein [Candidatus Sericytochromatia bacterium]
MQVNSPRQDMLGQVRGVISDRKVTPQEMQTLQTALSSSSLPPQDKQAMGQLLAKLGEFTQTQGERQGDQYLSEPELRSIQSMAAQLDSPAATRFSEELQAQNQPVAASSEAGPRIRMQKAPPEVGAEGASEAAGPKKSRSFFQVIADIFKAIFNWFAGLFGGGDKNNVKGPGPSGSAASAVSFDGPGSAQQAPPDLSAFDASQDYSESEFKQGDYLNEYARPEVPVNPEAFNQYMAVPTTLRPLPDSAKPEAEEPGEATAVDPAAPKPPAEVPDKPAPAAKPRSGAMYQRSRYHDDSKFVPQFPMAAFHESGVYRRDWDPYAVGAISRPKKGDDLGGKTYGTYQFESSVYIDGTSRGGKGGAGSTLSRFINDPANPFGSHLKAAAQKYGLASKAFDALWTKFAREHNQAFGLAQEAFVHKDKGDNVQRFMDLAKLSPEVRQDPRIQDLIMGTTNHVGELADGAARHLAGLQERAGRKFSANEIGKALADYKETKISSWFRSSPGAHAGIENRFEAEGRQFARA